MKWIDGNGQEPKNNEEVVCVLRDGFEVDGYPSIFRWDISGSSGDIMKWRYKNRVEFEKLSFQELCALLPDEFYWGDGLTPAILNDILSAYDKPVEKSKIAPGRFARKSDLFPAAQPATGHE